MPYDKGRCGFDFARHVSDILADEITGGKVLVFAHHRNVLNALEEGVLKAGGVEYIRIDGSTKVGILPSNQTQVYGAVLSSPLFRSFTWNLLT